MHAVPLPLLIVELLNGCLNNTSQNGMRFWNWPNIGKLANNMGQTLHWIQTHTHTHTHIHTHTHAHTSIHTHTHTHTHTRFRFTKKRSVDKTRDI